MLLPTRGHVLKIYERLQELQKTQGYETITVPEPEPKNTESIDKTDAEFTQKND